MLLKMFTVFDSKVECYLTPFFFRSRGEAIRAFTETVNDGKSMFSKFPGDYTLFDLGGFDETNGSFVLNDTPHSLGVAIEFVRNPSDSSVLNS